MEICIVTGLEKDIQTKIEIAGLLNHIFNKEKYFRFRLSHEDKHMRPT